MSIESAFARFPALTTDRLYLREIVPEDAEALFSTLSDEDTMRFYGHAPHRTIDDSRNLISQIHARYARQEAIRWGITLHGNNHLIGSCGFHHFDEGFHRAETGYELNRAFWGKGIMLEAMVAVVTYGFADLRLHRVEAIIDDLNERSKSLLRRLGFAYEGNLRQRYYIQDRFEDEHYYGLLRDEWHPA